MDTEEIELGTSRLDESDLLICLCVFTYILYDFTGGTKIYVHYVFVISPPNMYRKWYNVGDFNKASCSQKTSEGECE